MFAEWLCDVFSDKLLRGGVVDIAGGRGELAFELSVNLGNDMNPKRVYGS